MINQGYWALALGQEVSWGSFISMKCSTSLLLLFKWWATANYKSGTDVCQLVQGLQIRNKFWKMEHLLEMCSLLPVPLCCCCKTGGWADLKVIMKQILQCSFGKKKKKKEEMLENTIQNYLLQHSLLNKVSSLLYLIVFILAWALKGGAKHKYKEKNNRVCSCIVLIFSNRKKKQWNESDFNRLCSFSGKESCFKFFSSKLQWSKWYLEFKGKQSKEEKGRNCEPQ